MSIAQFIKESSLPIPVPAEPYLSYFLDLYDPHLSSKAKYERFKLEQRATGSSQDVRKQVIDHVEKSTAYQVFAKSDLSEYNLDIQFVKQFHFVDKVYSNQFSNQYFVSIDMMKGNFTALQFVDPDILDNASSYEEFISRYTDNEHVIQSKKIRQVIFGHLEPRRQQKVQKKIMEHLIRLLLESGLFEASQFKVFTNDEIVLQCECKKHLQETLPKLHKFLDEGRGSGPLSRVGLHVEAFYLTSIAARNGKILGFKKDFVLTEQEERDGKSAPPFVLKGVAMFLYAQVYKHCVGERIQLIDRAFMHEKILCHASNVFEENDLIEE